MLMTVTEARQYVTSDLTDAVLEEKLRALELLIRKHTNNNFQKKSFRFKCATSPEKGLLYASELFAAGDTVQLTDTALNEGVYTIASVDRENGCMRLNDTLYSEPEVTVTKVEYPTDIKMGAINMLKWDLENRAKVGIQSETISRHSVTYFNVDGANSTISYPNSLVGFLKPYKKARF